MKIMKKALTALLTLALLLACVTVPALAADITLISRDNIELHVTDCKLYDGSFLSMSVYVYVSNDNDYGVRFSATNATVNGTPVKSSGFGIEAYSEYGNNTQSILLQPSDEDPEGSSAALRSARAIEMDLTVRVDGTYEKLFEQHVSFDAVSDGSSDDTGYDDDIDDADFGHGGYDDDANYAPAYTPKSTNYKTLKKGSKGQAVRDLQQRLTDLGYLCDKVDGSYGRNTNTAVRSFQEQNNLPISSEASPEMQEKLYSSYAKYYVEPYLPLMIAGSFFLKNPIETGTSAGSMRIELVNRSSTQAIRGYELSFYQTDMYGNRIDYHPDGAGVYVFDHEILDYVEPGHYVNTDDSWLYPIRNYWSTYAVYVGVKKVVMDDGEVRELGHDDITYFECRVAE